MILLSPPCCSTLQLTGTTSAHGVWTVSEWVCLWVRQPPTSTLGQGMAAHNSPPSPLSVGGKLRCTAEMKPSEWFNRYWPQHMGNHIPWDATSCLIIKNMQKCTIYISELASANQKREIRKWHRSSHCPALCSPNTETKIRLLEIFSREFLHLWDAQWDLYSCVEKYKMGEKQ